MNVNAVEDDRDVDDERKPHRPNLIVLLILTRLKIFLDILRV